MAAEGCLVVSHASLPPMQQMNSRLVGGGDSATAAPRDNNSTSSTASRSNHDVAAVAMSMNVTDESACSDPSLANKLQKDTTNNKSLGELTANKPLKRRNTPPMSLSNSHDSADSTSSSSSDEDEEGKTAQHEEFIGEEDFEVALSWNRNNRVLLRRLEEAAPRGKLSMINLSRRGLSSDEAVLLHEVVRLNPLLSVLKLAYNDLGDTGTTVIAKSFAQDGRHHQMLSVLDLGFNNVGDAGCEALALLALAGNFTISQLYLSGNIIKGKGALAIAGAILHGTGLSSLHLTANNIGSNGLKAIAGAIAKQDAAALEALQQNQKDGSSIKTPTINELHIGHTGIDSDGFIAVPGLILSNASLTCLSIPNNNLSDQDMSMLSQALTQNKSIPLERLELSFNEITDQGVETLMNAIWGSPFLKVLKLDNNKWQDRGAQLCAVVLTSISLEVMDLSFNRITTAGVKALMKNISECNSLKSLGFSGIPVDQNASKALAFALAYNCSLTTLNLDNCSMGYSAQRHIVAGIVSNRKIALRVITGFPIVQIAMTLGLPRLPNWSNVQVLGFIRLMWQQWLLKSCNGRMQEILEIRGPAPPAAVASAAKICFSSLGVTPEKMFQTETHDLPFVEGPPVDPAKTALLERSPSGTLKVPDFSPDNAGELHEWAEEDLTQSTNTDHSKAALAVSHLEDPVRRNKNLKWLRTHFRSLSEVGRLPFNNADLWQLHQYYFSPPAVEADEPPAEPKAETVASSDVVSVPRNVPVQGGQTINKAVSFTSLGAALSQPNNSSLNDHKRGTDAIEERNNFESDSEPMTKRAKSSKPRIAFYPRVMAKIQALGTRPMDQTLALLRQLKYTENVFFEDKNPYEDTTLKDTVHQDVEMILLDLL